MKRSKGKVTPVKTPKQTTVTLYLSTERNSKFVRGMKKVREHIEWFHLPQYNPQKISDSRYELTFTYENNADQDEQICNLIQELHREA